MFHRIMFLFGLTTALECYTCGPEDGKVQYDNSKGGDDDDDDDDKDCDGNDDDLSWNSWRKNWVGLSENVQSPMSTEMSLRASDTIRVLTIFCF